MHLESGDESMDWNKNGRIDAADLLTTELFIDEVEKKTMQRNSANTSKNSKNEEQHSESKND